MYRVIKFKRGNTSKLRVRWVCVYDDTKVSRETVDTHIRKGQPSRNIFLIKEVAFNGILKDMVERANKYLEEGDKNNENISR